MTIPINRTLCGLLVALAFPFIAGADEPDRWWSLQPLERPETPSAAAWARSQIDAFIHRRLTDNQLLPAAEADRRTLARRLHFDLTGLPPTPDDADRFAADTEPDAYERLADRLLASPAFGERQARHWLDVARYADTHGFDKDKVRPNAWPYRDYVIRSFNEDKPYDRFVREQIAGDRFHPGTRDGVVGLGFLAAGPFDFVGQIEVRDGTAEKRRVRNLDRDEMVSAVMNTFVSLTAQCARCHDHKFDPVSQADYYRLQAVFAGVDRADRPYDPDPEVSRRRAALLQLQNRLREQEAEIRRRIIADAGAELAEVERELAEIAKLPDAPVRPEFGYHSHIEPNDRVAKWVQADLGEPVPIASVILAGCHDDFGGIGAGFGFPVRFRIDASDDPEFAEGVTPIADHTVADFANPGVRPMAFPAEGVTARYVRVTATRLAERQNDSIFALGELAVIDPAGDNRARGKPVTALDSIQAPPRWANANLTDGYHFGVKQGDNVLSRQAELSRRHERLIAEATTPGIREQLETIRHQAESLQSELLRLPENGTVYAAATHFQPEGEFKPAGGEPRSVFVLNRGEVDQPGDAVGPGKPPLVPGADAEFDLPADHSEADRRAALAAWIVADDNPLTWRSMVNRVWGEHFGRGIVTTPSDFGRMGRPPSHPELLDWLAVEFRDHGGSMKDLHRLMVMSASYRQSSAGSGGDGSDRYFGRMPPRRLDAEEVRDAILAASGTLRREMGGPGFRAFGFKDDHSPHYLYAEYNPDDSATHRRSAYRFVVRSVPDPWMQVRDCADPSRSVAKRVETTTALQALSQLNSGFVVRMAERFAERVEREAETPSRRVALAFRLALGREPSRAERELLVSVADRHGLPAACRLIFNLNEFVFVD